MTAQLVVYVVFHIHGWLRLHFISVCDGVCFLFGFGVAICHYFIFYIGHASYSVFPLFADQSAVVHFFLGPSQFLSSIFMRSYCRLRQLCWDCFHT